MKAFIKEWKPKKMSKDERLNYLSANLQELIDFFNKKSRKDPQTLKQLFELMEDIKTAKTFKALVKEDENIDSGIVSLLYSFITAYHHKVKPDDEKGLEVLNLYNDCIDSILKKPIKKMVKKTGITEDNAKELLIVLPNRKIVKNEYLASLYTNRLLKKFYDIALKDKIADAEKDKTKELYESIFKFLIDKDLYTAICIQVLLEYKENSKNLKANQKVVWSALTEMALTGLEDGYKPKVIKEFIKVYVEKRKADQKKNRDQARRIILSQNIDKEAHPKLSAVIDELVEKKNYADFL